MTTDLRLSCGHGQYEEHLLLFIASEPSEYNRGGARKGERIMCPGGHAIPVVQLLDTKEGSHIGECYVELDDHGFVGAPGTYALVKVPDDATLEDHHWPTIQLTSSGDGPNVPGINTTTTPIAPRRYFQKRPMTAATEIE